MRAVPTVDQLLLLSNAGILKAPANEETTCRVDYETGEIVCDHNGDPSKDCRLPYCRHAALMRMRLVSRLGQVYARERKRLVGI